MLFNFFIMVFLTKDIIVTALSTFSLGMIVSNMLCTISFMDWQIGVVESTGVIVFIGISVDYVVHFGYSYVTAPFSNRRDRTQHAFKSIGSTIFASGLTTIFSAIFLLMCNADDLYKFGVLLLVAVLSAMLVSLTFLPASLFVFGPHESGRYIKMFLAFLDRKFSRVSNTPES